MARDEVKLSEKDLQNLARAEKAASGRGGGGGGGGGSGGVGGNGGIGRGGGGGGCRGGGGGGGGGGGAGIGETKTLDDVKSKISELEKEEEQSLLRPRVKLVCPKAPQRLRANEKGGDYEPRVISLGPYHHGKPHLKEGESLKLKLAATYIKFAAAHRKQALEQSIYDDIYGTISSRVEELKACYDVEFMGKFGRDEGDDEEFIVMMMLDGCALLSYVILCVCFGFPLEKFNIRYQDLSRIHQDVLLLENQLPYQSLLRHLIVKTMDPEWRAMDLWTAMFREFFGMNEDQSLFRDLFFIGADPEENPSRRKAKNRKRSKPKGDQEEESSRRCHHVLDLYRRSFLGDERSYPTCNSGAGTGFGENVKGMGVSVWDVKEQVMASFRNVKELMAAGIRIKRSPTRFLRDVSFASNGITASLRLPTITIDKSTKTLFLNLIACELSSDVEHDFISYLRLLDSLIDHADDVKELQSVGVVQNNLGTHDQVAEFFNTISANLESNFHAYKDVRVGIRKHQQSHYNSRVKMWMTECLDTYFGTPWAIIAWLAAFLALFLTAIQTFFQVYPNSNSS